LKPRPILVLNPRSDRSFVTYVDHLSREELTTAVALQARLREQFPRAVVHARGLSGEDVTMWYVYRDGHWTSDQAGPDRSSDRAPDQSADQPSDEAQEGNGVGAGGRSSGDD
jgi:hypothetical protein